MKVDWKLLIQIRERHKLAAQEAVAAQKRVVEAHEQIHSAASNAWQEELAARVALWERTRGGDGGALSIAQLSQATAWGQTLDRRIARAARTMDEARGQLAQHQLQLTAARRALRDAAADLTKAQQMQERQAALARSASERRQEAATEDAAEQTWLAATRRGTLLT